MTEKIDALESYVSVLYLALKEADNATTLAEITNSQRIINEIDPPVEKQEIVKFLGLAKTHYRSPNLRNLQKIGMCIHDLDQIIEHLPRFAASITNRPRIIREAGPYYPSPIPTLPAPSFPLVSKTATTIKSSIHKSILAKTLDSVVADRDKIVTAYVAKASSVHRAWKQISGLENVGMKSRHLIPICAGHKQNISSRNLRRILLADNLEPHELIDEKDCVRREFKQLVFSLISMPLRRHK